MLQLTEEQRLQWQTNGYLHLKQVFDADEVAFFSDEMDRMRQLPGYEPDRNPELPIGHYKWLDHAEDIDPDGFMDRRDLLTYHDAFIDLIDRAPVFDYVVDLMGPNILLSMTQAIVRPSDDFPGYTHTDGGESLRMTRVSESSPPIAMKAMYLLTTVTEEDSANLTVFPGSHTRQIPRHSEQVMTPYSEGAIQLMGDAGDVYLFPHSLWHGPSKNLSGKSRKVMLYNYCQLWVRSYDHDNIPAVAQRCSPRQRRLLGDLGYDFRPGSYFYVPKDQRQVILSVEP
ncbi:MAG: phytanoyl-CoA dioxygenase family protein [Proteobacteria bacterium]|nr:phytanoyl-CoA dioxygenase family protein [Pseudomonadota bacterium]